MITRARLEEELAEAKRLLNRGKAKKVLDRLNLIFSELDSRDPSQIFDAVVVLYWMSVAAADLGLEDASKHLFSNASRILRDSNPLPNPRQAEIYLNLAETLSIRELPKEAIHFAECALECVIADPDKFEYDDFAEILRRYAAIAKRVGWNSSAQFALILGLLLVHEASGVTSKIAFDIVSLADATFEKTSTSTLSRVGKIAVQMLAA